MATKTFEDETFTIEKIKVEQNDLTEADPYIGHIEIYPEEDVSFDFIKYSANKEVLEETKKTHHSGVEFESMSTRQRDQKFSELPEKIVKIQALINDGKEVKIHTDIGRWTSDDEDSDATTFYITDDQLKNAEIVVDEEDSENEDEEESSSEDQDSESQDGSADSNGETEDTEDSTSESSEDDEETVF